MLCSDVTLYRMLDRIVHPDDMNITLVNAASLDIRIGRKVLYEVPGGYPDEGPRFKEWDLIDRGKFYIRPGGFCLVETFERITVPNGYAMDLRLKSSSARLGHNHSLAFWVDPGWGCGEQGFSRLTMELKSNLQFNSIPIHYKQRFAQVILWQVDSLSANPYNGRYQNAQTVEAAKS